MIRTLTALALLLPPLTAWTIGQASGQEAAAEVSNPATAPVPRDDGWWYERHGLLCRRAKEGPAELVFLGDSITQGWEGAGAEVWKEAYGERGAVNLGIGGDQTQHVLWRLEHGNWPGITPRAVVLMIGTNNVGNNNGTHSAAMIAAGIEAIVKRIRTASPETHILLLAIFPRDPGASPKREVIADINMRIQGLADGKTVRYLDIGPSFLEADGVTLTKEIMPDYLHLSPEGYRRWAEAIEPQLAEWLAE